MLKTAAHDYSSNIGMWSSKNGEFSLSIAIHFLFFVTNYCTGGFVIFIFFGRCQRLKCVFFVYRLSAALQLAPLQKG